MLEAPLAALAEIARELTITVGDGSVWASTGVGLLFGSVCLAIGVSIARAVGLLRDQARAGETMGVGLATGLIVLAAAWATIWSGGRSAFTPPAVGISMAMVLARRRAWKIGRPSRCLVLAVAASGLFVVGTALLYGATIAPSSRDGVQPVEHPDHAFYAVLGRDLAATGIETNLSASGFELEGLPAQAWYHWGEIWLATVPIKLAGSAPLAARYFVVLPSVLLAAAAWSGTLVRRLARTRSRRAFAFAFACCLFLVPVPLLEGPFFSSWAFGMALGITLYGLGAVVVLLAMYCALVLDDRRPSWKLSIFIAGIVAFIVPAHLALAVLGCVAVGTVVALRIARALVDDQRLPALPGIWRKALVATAIAVLATVAWGQLTGHSLGASGGVPPAVTAFNDSWSGSVAITLLGGGLLFGVPIGWVLIRRRWQLEASIYLGTMAAIAVGAVLWGWRLADLNTFYLFF